MRTCVKCSKALEPSEAYKFYGVHRQCFMAWFRLPVFQYFEDFDHQESSSSDLYNKRVKSTFLHGNYLKYTAYLNKQSYIIKIQEEKAPELPGMEYTCNKIAQTLSITVPPFYYLMFVEKPAFITKNFMHGSVGTLNHIYKYLPEGEKHHSCKEIIKVIERETGKLTDIFRFIEICLFDALIGNNDRHGRNLGIINNRGKKTLSPMYDNPSYFGVIEDSMLSIDFNPSGSIWTSGSKRPKVREYLKEFKEMRYEKVSDHFKKKLFSKLNAIRKNIKNSPISEKRRKAFLEFIEKRAEEFNDER